MKVSENETYFRDHLWFESVMLFSEAKWQNGLASYCIFVTEFFTKTPSVKQHSKEIVFKKFNLQHKLPQNK